MNAPRLDFDAVRQRELLDGFSPEDQIIVALLAANETPPLPSATPPDSAKIVERLLQCWQILPSLPESIFRDWLGQFVTAEDHRRLHNARLAVTDFEKAQIAGNRGFLNSLKQHGIHHTLLKGAASACLLYPERQMRAAWDFDVGVGWNDLRDAEALALAAGFHQAQRDRDAPRFYRADRRLRAIVEESHFELGFLVRRLQVTNLSAETKAAIKAEKWCHQFWHDADTDKPWCYAVLDIHHKLSLDIGLDDLLLTVTSVERGGEQINVPDFAWFAAHLIFKLYWEGVHNYGKGLYQCADLVRLIPHLDEPTFDRLVNILDTYNLAAGAFYAFNHLADFGIAPPPHIARFIDTARVPPNDGDPIEFNDLGDVWPKLWGRR
jgi:hypothetical protein